MKYIITTFTVVNGRCLVTAQEFSEDQHYLAALSLDWALNINIWDRDELHLIAKNKDESGKPFLQVTKMPGYENHPPIYLTFEIINE